MPRTRLRTLTAPSPRAASPCVLSPRHASRRLRSRGAALVCSLGLLLAGCVMNSGFARTRLEQGERALASKDLDVALAEFQEAVRLDPQLAEGHARLGDVYQERGELRRAADAFQAAARLDPFDFSSFFKLGDIYTLLEDIASAVRAYARACKLRPDAFEPRFKLAMSQQRSGDLQDAVESYREALKLEPRDARAWSNLGAAYDVLGRQYDAIGAYKQALECDGQQPLVLVNLATVYLNQERFSSARKTLEAALRLAPEMSAAHERLGYCHWREGQLAGSADEYTRAIASDSRNPRAHAGYGIVRMTQYLEDPGQVGYRTEAIEAWHRSLECDPQQPKLRELIAKYRAPREPPLLTAEP